MTAMLRAAILMVFSCSLAACGGSGSNYANAPAAPTYRSGNLTPPIAQTSARGLNAYVIRGIKYYPRDDIGYRQRGYASWYGPNFHGKLTANGERFNQYALTAAHKTIPLGSFVKVTNLENGRSLVLLINDRGPFVSGRIIDLSKRSAELLDVIKKGTARVQVERTNRSGRPLVRRAAVQQAAAKPTAQPARVQQVAAPQPAPVQLSQPTPAFDGPILIQVASFSDFYNARKLQQGLASEGPTAITQITAATGQIFYRVQVGPFADPHSAEDALADIHAKGHTDAKLHGIKVIPSSSR